MLATTKCKNIKTPFPKFFFLIIFTLFYVCELYFESLIQTFDLPLIQKGSIQELKVYSTAFSFLECENAYKLIALLYQNY